MRNDDDKDVRGISWISSGFILRELSRRANDPKDRETADKELEQLDRENAEDAASTIQERAYSSPIWYAPPAKK
jgi:hypothetical protein